MARNRAIARLAASHQGVLTHEQLVAAGLGPDAIKHRVASGLLHRRHRGVYVVGHLALAPLANERAALLGCGEGALLSHRSAAAAWSLVAADAGGVVDVTLVGRKCRPKAGVRLHRVARLDPRDARLMSNLALTAPARALLDFAADASSGELERAIAEARVRRLVGDQDLRDAIDRAPTRAGTRALRALLRREHGPALTRSEAERKLLKLLRDARLPEPESNVRIHGLEVDFLWRDAGLVVEVDGHAFHGGRVAFERDRRRDQALVAAGLRVIRVTWRQIVEEPFAVIARIAQALQAARALQAV